MKLLDILDQFTALETDKDLFYLEMPLKTSGLWVEELQTPKTKTGYRDYNFYYRGKDKAKCLENLEYLDDSIDNLDECYVDGEKFYLERQYEWSYVGKDSEGYYVFNNVYRLF